ncbi:uncharacterized protein BJ212DRAFT_1487098 [Suillus subaureus]|uniref:Uncharacterized protein n=1 Tax=Suillus subaureus TaxID=48587 RepID=A0A9P7DUF5_9AGAM|nr:uncharacterized protein BJ212DRAFT_1487098 [Suillus subaureus]KAG1803231.1 hypothetical protein BJ212DRAFT_1487098 [Suillus subaureus]
MYLIANDLATGIDPEDQSDEEAVISNNPWAAVPWGHVTQDPDHYLDMDCISQNVVIKDPSHLQKEAIISSDEDEVLKKTPQAIASDKEEDLECHTPSLSNSCPKFHMGGDTVSYLQSHSTLPSYHHLLATVQKLSNTYTPDPKGKARKQHLPVWASWTWSEAYLPQNMHNDVQASFVALEELGNYIIKSHDWGMIEYEADEAGDDVPQYLGDSILGFKVGDKIEEAITRIQVKVDTMLPDGNEKQMTVGEEVHMRHLENKRQVKERRERVAEEAQVVEKARVAQEKRVAEASWITEKRAATSKKASSTNTGGKGKGKHTATDVDDSVMKKVKISAPPDPPCHSARDRVASKKYKN